MKFIIFDIISPAHAYSYYLAHDMHKRKRIKREVKFFLNSASALNVCTCTYRHPLPYLYLVWFIRTAPTLNFTQYLYVIMSYQFYHYHIFILSHERLEVRGFAYKAEPFSVSHHLYTQEV